MKFAFMAVEEAHLPLRFMRTRLAVLPSGFYASQKRQVSKHAKQDVFLAAMVAEAHLGGLGTTGSPRVRSALKRGGTTSAASGWPS